ncbi:MAG: AarF/ABC1/UbiB kinase family protein [Verrucomicrobiota bacterium]
MFFRQLENIGKTIQHLHRYRDIVRVFLKYGYEDLAHRIHLPALLDIPIKSLRRDQPDISHLPPPERLRRACEELGPTFIKMGQILSTRSDLLPEAFTKELSKLQDQVTPIAFEEVREVLRKELKRPLEEIYDYIEPLPLGSASIAQVHKAKLRDGKDAVVKVQRPGVPELVTVDLEIMHHIATLMENHLEGWKVHKPTLIVDVIARTLQKEIDFMAEAAHIERFSWQFAGEPSVYIPKVYHVATTPKVLTMEFIDGIKVSALIGMETTLFERKEIARRITDLVMKQIFVHGFFHADPHPANIHILPEQVVCFLDYGMMGFVDQRGREAFADLVAGIARRNEISVANALLKLAAADSEPPRQGLEADVAEFMHQHFYRPMKDVEFGKLLGQLFHLTARYGLRMPPDFFIMIKALTLTEGLVRRLHPEHDIIEQAAPFLKGVRLNRVKPKRFFEGLFEFGVDVADMARELPAELRRIFSQVKTGEAKMVFRHDGLDPLIHSGERISNRLSFSIVLAALIIGSSLMVHADIPPKWNGIPIIGLIGFVLATFMGFWLLVAILRHGKM